MKKEDIQLIAQLLSSTKDALSRLDEAQKKKDLESFNSSKKEILSLQEKISKLI